MAETEDFYSSRIVNCVFNAFLSYIAITMNAVTVLALRKTSSLPKPLKTLLLSLAVADLGVGLVVQPLYIAKIVMKMEQNKYNETFNNVASALHKTGNFLYFASFFSVTALSVDRFLAIHLHLRYQELVTPKRVAALVISIWMFSAFLPLHSLCISINVRVKMIILLTIKIFCYISTGFCCYKIYLVVRRHANQIQVLQVQQFEPNSETISKFARLRKSAAGTFCVYLVFVACNLPNTCVLIAYINGERSSLIDHVNLFFWTLMLLNSSLNPLIYCWKMRDIRHAIINILRNIFPSQN